MSEDDEELGKHKKRLLIISNRLPIKITKRAGKLRFQQSTGGLATGLGTFYKSYESLWIGWPGIATNKLSKEEREEVKKRLVKEKCYPVFLSQNDIENYYYGFCNKTIWPLFHYFPLYTIYSKSFWEVYKKVNKVFLNVLLEVYKPRDTIWVHDYHLMLLPKLIREALPNATIGFFLHIPFPSFEIFRLLPWRRKILEGLLGADLIGFHTYDYVEHFLSSVRCILGIEHTLGQIITNNHLVKVDIFPMGIDYERFSNLVNTPKVRKEVTRIRKKIGERKIILSIDRLDYTKGIAQRLEAFDLFLQKNQEYKEKITLVLIAVPSRTKIEHYKKMKKQVDELVGRINGKHGTIDWMPVWYMYRFLPSNTLAALYHLADVALITPLRDGMNLIAKEFIASKRDKGVLILSEMAGAAKELGEAIIVNPNNKERIVEALERALKMPVEEQIERNRIMQKRLKRYNVVRWANDFIERLRHVKRSQQKLCVRKLTAEARKKLIERYRESKRRLILLDYDGTLVPFAQTPQMAKPDGMLLELLRAVTQNNGNEIVIISGRDKNTLNEWFGKLNVGLIAEHGMWIKEKGKEWKAIEPLRNGWKNEIRPILELYMDRTPGSFIEEKESSLAWHYRNADPKLSSVRLRELKEAVLHLTTNLNLGILEGDKVIEIKNNHVNKGLAASYWLSKKKWDFILAIGDDKTDEDLFAALPKSAYSIKVGPEPSRARFNVGSIIHVRSLLKELLKEEAKVQLPNALTKQ